MAYEPSLLLPALPLTLPACAAPHSSCLRCPSLFLPALPLTLFLPALPLTLLACAAHHPSYLRCPSLFLRALPLTLPACAAPHSSCVRCPSLFLRALPLTLAACAALPSSGQGDRQASRAGEVSSAVPLRGEGRGGARDSRALVNIITQGLLKVANALPLVASRPALRVPHRAFATFQQGCRCTKDART